MPTSGRERYRFPYPTSFIPIPYHTDTTLTSLSSFVIPMARSAREISVDIPVHVSPPELTLHDMAIDGTHDSVASRSTTSVIARVDSDGLLLYVSHASYEEGTSPLSCWVPNKAITKRPELHSSSEGHDSPLDVFQRYVMCSSIMFLNTYSISVWFSGAL
jgi:snurportin-1